MPTEAYCADALHLSPHYFRDLLKFETGKDMHEYFQLMRLDAAKKMLLDRDNTLDIVTLNWDIQIHGASPICSKNNRNDTGGI